MRHTLLLLVFAGAFTLAQAQLKLGLKGGLNFSDVAVASSLSQGQVPELSSATHYHIGAFLRVGIGFLALQPEFLISSKGGLIDAGGGANTSLNLTYASVPVLLVFKPIPIIGLHAGPEFGFLLSAKEGGTDVKSRFQGSDLGIAVGAQADLPLGLQAGVRYVLGVSKVSEFDVTDPLGTVIGSGSYKNRVLQAYVGWAFL